MRWLFNIFTNSFDMVGVDSGGTSTPTVPAGALQFIDGGYIEFISSGYIEFIT